VSARSSSKPGTTLLFSASLIVAMLAYDPALGLLALAPIPIALVLAKAAGTVVARRTRQPPARPTAR